MKLFYIDPQSYHNLAIYDTSLLQNIDDTDIVYFCNTKYQCTHIDGIDYRNIFDYSDKHGIAKAISYTASIIRICIAALRERPDVAHIQWFRLFYVDCFLVLLFRLLNTKVVHTAHNTIPHNHTPRDISHYSWYYRHSDAIIVHTNSSQRELTSAFSIPTSKVHVIPHGLLASSINKAEVKKRANELMVSLSIGHKTVFGVLGNQNYYKGIDIITDVWASTPELNSCTDIILLIVGRTENADLSGLRKFKNVIIRDEVVSDLDFDAYLELSSVLLLPYRSISQSGVLLTALQRQKPVVVSDAGGLTDPFRIANVGWNIGAATADSLRSTLLSLKDNPKEILAIGNNKDGFDKINEAYSWEKIGKATTSLYNNLKLC